MTTSELAVTRLLCGDLDANNLLAVVPHLKVCSTCANREPKLLYAASIPGDIQNGLSAHRPALKGLQGSQSGIGFHLVADDVLEGTSVPLTRGRLQRSKDL